MISCLAFRAFAPGEGEAKKTGARGCAGEDFGAWGRLPPLSYPTFFRRLDLGKVSDTKGASIHNYWSASTLDAKSTMTFASFSGASMAT
jgi:hypothetical protein